jgi:hypothetical protein
MRRVILAAGSSVAVCVSLLATASTASGEGHEQIVFSGEAEGSLGEAEFWIWCAVDDAGGYDDCNGAMRFDDLHLARHVEGEVTEIAEGMYRMDVASTLDDSVACTLTNLPPITRGPTNTVTVSCSTPSGDAIGSDVVVTNGG